MPDPIPRSEEEFDQLMHTFVPYAADHGPELGLPNGMVTDLSSALQIWTDAYGTRKDALAAAMAATAAMKSARTALTKLARPAIQLVQNNPAVHDDARKAMGLRLPENPRARVPIPTSRPIGTVDTSQRLQHTLNWQDEASPNSIAKPDGVRGVEIWLHIGPTPPAGPDQCQFVALDSSTPYLLVHNAADAGKLAHYMLRWQNTRNEFGPWSETISATITG